MVLDIPHLLPLCDKISGLKKGFVDIKDGKLYYEEEGQGIPLVLLNPGPGGSHNFFHPYFSRLKNIARIIYYDARGSGKSSADDTGVTYTIKQAVEDLEDLRKHLKIDQWMVLGWSFGGLLAQCYALTYPDRIKGLILVAAVAGLPKVKMLPGRHQEFLTKAENKAIREVFEAEARGELSNVQMIYNIKLYGHWKRQHLYKPTKEELVRAALYGCNIAPGYNVLMSKNGHQIDLQNKFDDFEIPTLLMEAKWDLSWNIDKARLVRQNHPKAQFEYFEHSSHCIFSDEPDKFFKILRKFVQESDLKKIEYKPGNRIKLPELPSKIGSMLTVLKEKMKDKDALARAIENLYEQALKEDLINSDVWFKLSDYFIRTKKNFQKTLIALQQYERSMREKDAVTWKKYGYVMKTWQGQMLDLLGRRDEALKEYKKALEMNDGRSDNWFGGLFIIDKTLIEKRLKEPFKWGKEVS